MGHPHRRHCLICGKHADECGELSWNGYCVPCGMALLEENVIGIATKSGPAHRRRLRGIARYLERELTEAPPPAA